MKHHFSYGHSYGTISSFLLWPHFSHFLTPTGPAPPPPHFLDQCGPEMHPPSPCDWNKKWLALWRGDSFRKSSSSAFQRFICFMFQISIYQPGNCWVNQETSLYAFRLSPCTMTFVATNVAFLGWRHWRLWREPFWFEGCIGSQIFIEIEIETICMKKLHPNGKSCGAWAASKWNLL